VARLIGAGPSEIVFTSGATEANNLAILGTVQWAVASGVSRRRIVVSAVEHKAVLEPARALLAQGFSLAIAPVSRSGIIDLMALADLLDEETLLVCVMAANNETGAIQPVREAVALSHRVGVLVHCDAAQAVGKIHVDVVDLDVDYLSLSAHKLYGPMGVGALYVSAAAPTPGALQFGGGQQAGVRPGTEPVPLIAGFAAASAVARARMAADGTRAVRLANRLVSLLRQHQVAVARATGDAPVLPGSVCLRLDDIDADDLVTSLAATVCISTGSACTTGQILPSHVLRAMGYDQAEARSIFRIYCGRYNTDDDIDRAAPLIASAYDRVRHRTGRTRQFDVEMPYEARPSRF
jgi:cysteine desulfurase